MTNVCWLILEQIEALRRQDDIAVLKCSTNNILMAADIASTTVNESQVAERNLSSQQIKLNFGELMSLTLSLKDDKKTLVVRYIDVQYVQYTFIIDMCLSSLSTSFNIDHSSIIHQTHFIISLLSSIINIIYLFIVLFSYCCPKIILKVRQITKFDIRFKFN